MELTGRSDRPSTDRQLRSELRIRTEDVDVDRTATRKRSLTCRWTLTGPRRRPYPEAERRSDCCVDPHSTTRSRGVERTGPRRLHVHINRTVMLPDRPDESTEPRVRVDQAPSYKSSALDAYLQAPQFNQSTKTHRSESTLLPHSCSVLAPFSLRRPTPRPSIRHSSQRQPRLPSRFSPGRLQTR